MIKKTFLAGLDWTTVLFDLHLSMKNTYNKQISSHLILVFGTTILKNQCNGVGTNHRNSIRLSVN